MELLKDQEVNCSNSLPIVLSCYSLASLRLKPFAQQILRTKYGVYEVAQESTSVTALMSSVIHYAAVNQREQHRLLSDADKIAKKFRIPEKRVWHIKVKAFADSKQWSNLRLLADSKSKSPIGTGQEWMRH